MKVAFRVDGSQQIGTGHVARCMALADALHQNKVDCHFLCRHLPDALGEAIQAKGHSVVKLHGTEGLPDMQSDRPYSAWLGVSQQRDAADTLAAIALDEFDWLVVDHYALDILWERQIRDSVRRILAIDDLADRQHDCDVLLDQNFYIDGEHRYQGKVPEHCELLLGTRYSLLRPEFYEQRLIRHARQDGVRRILVFFGGADMANLTMIAIDALKQLDLPELVVDVVVGSEHPKLSIIEASCRANGYVLHVQTQRMAELMARADLAVGAGGSATWERCCLGLSCITFAIADNQSRLVQDAAVTGLLYAPEISPTDSAALAHHIQALAQNPLLVRSISERGMRMVDGRGALRVQRAMGIAAVTIRKSHADDAMRLFEWRNHASIRKWSRSSEIIDWATHRSWFESVISNPQKALLIGEAGGVPVGVVRFDMSGDQAEISIYMVPGHAGRSMSADLLLAAEMWLEKCRPDIKQLNADVVGDNLPSHRLFAQSGYRTTFTTYAKEMKDR